MSLNANKYDVSDELNVKVALNNIGVIRFKSTLFCFSFDPFFCHIEDTKDLMNKSL